MPIVVRILSILFAIGLVVLMYFVTVWILGLFGIVLPQHILTVIFTLIGIAMAIGVLTGRFDNINWWGPGPRV